MEQKIWANSGDSHLMEPFELPREPAAGAGRPDAAQRGRRGRALRDGPCRRTAVPAQAPVLEAAHGRHRDRQERLRPCAGGERHATAAQGSQPGGGLGELVYTSIGMWMHSIRDPLLMLAGCQVINDWSIEFQRFSPRYVCTAMIPTLSVETAVAEVERTADMGFKIAMLPMSPTIDGPNWNREDWHPLWAVLAETGMHVGFHAGSDPHDADTFNGTYHRGPGGHLMNYYEASYHMQLAATKLVASGVFERHPTLKCIVSEGGATWVPFMADRLDEAYRQHVNQVWPKFSRLPSEYLFENVYASFQHDRPRSRHCGDGLPERVLGERLSPPRGHVRAHPEDAPRARRRPHARAPQAHHPGRVPGCSRMSTGTGRRRRAGRRHSATSPPTAVASTTVSRRRSRRSSGAWWRTTRARTPTRAPAPTSSVVATWP